jgi:serine/threonine protein kinase
MELVRKVPVQGQELLEEEEEPVTPEGGTQRGSVLKDRLKELKQQRSSFLVGDEEDEQDEEDQAGGEQPASVAGSSLEQGGSESQQLGMDACSSASLYSAPEQLASPFVGESCDCPATDVYRVAAVMLMALRARGPLGAPMRGALPKGGAEREFATLRRLGHDCIMRRAEAGPAASSFSQESCSIEESAAGSLPLEVSCWRPTEDCRTMFANSLAKLLVGLSDVAGMKNKELVPWFRRSLMRDPGNRTQTPEESLQDLDDVWSEVETRMIMEQNEKRQAEANFEAPSPDGDDSRGSSKLSMRSKEKTPESRYLSFAPPPELELMTVL